MMAGGVGAGRRLSRHTAAQITAVLAIAVVAGIGAGAAAHVLLANSPAPVVAATTHGPLHGQATWPAGARPAPAITTLHDQTGAHFSLGSLHGHTVAVEFFDSHCKA